MPIDIGFFFVDYALSYRAPDLESVRSAVGEFGEESLWPGRPNITASCIRIFFNLASFPSPESAATESHQRLVPTGISNIAHGVDAPLDFLLRRLAHFLASDPVLPGFLAFGVDDPINELGSLIKPFGFL